MDEDSKHQDDNFQQNAGETNPMHDLTKDEELPEDNDTPFSPPDGTQDRIDSTFQTTDSNMTEQGVYDAGTEGEAGIDLPGQAADEEGANLPDTEE